MPCIARILRRLAWTQVTSGGGTHVLNSLGFYWCLTEHLDADVVVGYGPNLATSGPALWHDLRNLPWLLFDTRLVVTTEERC